MKIKVLVENSALDGFECEHGLSLLIEFNNKKYLLDAGQSEKFMKNAQKLGIDLSDTECAILSHGHYDHAGGFLDFFKSIPTLKVYAMKNAVNEYFSENGGIHYIGIPKGILENYGSRFIYTDCQMPIDTDVYIIPHSSENLSEMGKRAGLYMKTDEGMVPDSFSHELSLVFNTEKGLVIFNSCSHGGLRNIVEEVKTAFPDKQVYAFVGGLHMKGTKEGKEYCIFGEDEITGLIEYILKEGISIIYTGHCTGNLGMEMLMNKSDIVKRITSGMEICI